MMAFGMTSQECRTLSKKYVRLGADRTISIRRATALRAIALSYTTLAKQLDRLSSIQENENGEAP